MISVQFRASVTEVIWVSTFIALTIFVFIRISSLSRVGGLIGIRVWGLATCVDQMAIPTTIGAHATC